MNAPAIVSGDGSAPSVRAGMETSRTRTLRNERDRAVSTSSVSMSSSSGRTPTSRTSRTRSGSALAVSVETRVGWLEMPLASSSSFSNVVAPTVRSSTLTVRVGPSVDAFDQEDLAGPILVEGDRLGGAGVGVGDGSGLADLRRVPVAEGEVVQAGRGDLVGRDDDLVAIGLARDGDRAVDHADPPGGRDPLDIGVKPGERTGRRALRGEDPTVDDDVAGRQVDVAARPGEGP